MFIKWCGGKSKITSDIVRNLPEKIGTYYEPFVGGGAVFFELARQKRFKKAIISDLNSDLINTFIQVRDNTDSLIKTLNNGEFLYDKKTYLKIRALETTSLTGIENAARFIYLNKTCFNGLYRVNKLGKFNVPFGKYTNPLICDEPKLIYFSKLLQNTKIVSEDFEKVLKKVKLGDAVYADPPYVPISKTSSFVGYNGPGFTIADHERLASVFNGLVKKNVSIVVSNSSSPLVKEMYDGHNFFEVTGARSVGGHTEYRKPVTEFIITAAPPLNYDI